MSKSDLLNKLEDAISALREEVEKNEGSTIATIGNTIGSGIESLREGIMGNKNAQKVMESLKKHMGDLEGAIIKSDKKLSAKAMDAMQKGMQELRAKIGDDKSNMPDPANAKKDAPAPGSAKKSAAAKSKPAGTAKPAAAAKPAAKKATSSTAKSKTTAKATAKTTASGETKAKAKPKTSSAKPKPAVAKQASSTDK